MVDTVESARFSREGEERGGARTEDDEDGVKDGVSEEFRKGVMGGAADGVAPKWGEVEAVDDICAVIGCV